MLGGWKKGVLWRQLSEELSEAIATSINNAAVAFELVFLRRDFNYIIYVYEYILFA